ncbi:uncharacterized protein PSFLO_05658 [Pseudozyma flocculosa]|uniref:Arrestin C-terminal-like domain-containing protein n=1 Tax=Pseudozyma flocculosa TaxID=84751 RepID=A0A5C3F7Z8_9BASI|nr:uncharacterized protein PSFLO_05658 [Pseudozyma flocculosa]
MFSTLFQPCELRLHLLQNAIFLHPPDRPLPESHERPPQANDELVRGMVELYVPSNRHIAGIRVRLKAVQTVAILDASTGLTPISWEDSTVLERVVEIGIPHHDKDKHHSHKHGHANAHPPSSSSHHGHGQRSLSIGPAASAAATEERGRSSASSSRPMRGSSAFGLRSHSPGGSIPASMARAISRGRRLASGMDRISHSPSPSSSRPGSRAPSPSPPPFVSATERGRPTSTRQPPAYDRTISDDASGGHGGLHSASSHPGSQGSASVPRTPESELADISYPVSRNATPQLSRRPSFSGAHSPLHEHDQPPPDYDTAESGAAPADADLAAHLRRSLAVHADHDAGRRSSSAAPSSSSTSQRDRSVTPMSRSSQQRDSSTNGKGKSRSTSVGWAPDLHLFGGKHKGSRSKSRAAAAAASGAPLGRSGAGELDDVDEEQQMRGRSARASSKSRRRGSGGGGVGDDHDGAHDTGEHSESGWETEPREEGLELQKGVHGFEFAFIIPCDSPPYERSPFGRVRYIIKATAIGAGRAKSNVECWRDMYPMVNPSPDSGPTPLTVLYNDLHPTVGLVSIACTSNNISVGGVFNIDINSPAPPQDLIVYLVRVSLETTIELHTKKKGKQVVPVQRHKLFEKGWVPPKNNDGSHGDGKKAEGFIRNQGNDHAWTVQGLARMPDDNHIRASTSGGTKASIRFSHVLVVEIVHSRRAASGGGSGGGDGNGKDHEDEGEVRSRKLKVFALRQPVLIPSCCCAYDAVTLPAYTPDPDPTTRKAEMPWDIGSHHGGAEPSSSSSSSGAAAASQQANGGPSRHEVPGIGLYGTDTSKGISGQSHMYCVCGMSLQDLSAQERALIPSRPIEVLDGAGFRHQGKIGELPAASAAVGGHGGGSGGGSGSSGAATTAGRRRSPSTSSTSSSIRGVTALRARRSSSSSTTRASVGGGLGRRVSIGRSTSIVPTARRGSTDADGGSKPDEPSIDADIVEER